MEVCRKLAMVTSSDLLAIGLQHTVSDVEWCVIHDEELEALPASTLGMDGLLVHPVSWEQMGRWRPFLQRRFRTVPWMVLSDFRIAGAYLSFLPERCALLGPSIDPSELHHILRLLKENELPPPSWALQKRFVAGSEQLPNAKKVKALTPKELEYLCCVSLGMVNQQIATLQQVKVGTVKVVLSHAKLKVPCATREEVASYIERVFSCSELSTRSMKDITYR